MWKFLRTWIPQLVLAVAVAFLIFNLLPPLKMFFEQDWKALLFSYTLDYGEGPLLDQTLRLAHFQNIYRFDLNQPPYTISNYPPFFPLIQVPFMWIFGPALWYGRLLSILSILASAVLIGLTLQAITHSNLAGVASGLVLLVIPYVFYWSPLNRIDNLALVLSWTGLYVIVRGSSRQAQQQAETRSSYSVLKSFQNDLTGQPWLITGAAFLVAAIFTRQSYALAAPLAAFVWLVHLAPRRRALHLAAMVAGASLLLVLLLTLTSLGGFYTNVVTANVNPFLWSIVHDYATAIWSNMRFMVVGAAAFLLAGAIKPWRAAAWWLVAPYLIGAVLSGLTIGKVGSNVNYLLEFSAALSLAAGALIAWLNKNYWVWRTVLVVMVAIQVTTIHNWSKQEYYPRHTARMVLQSADLARLTALVKNTNGVILADEHMALLPLNGKNIYIQPFEFKMMGQAGLWDQQPFVEQIKRKEFALILLYEASNWDSLHGRWTDEQLNAIYANYARGPRLADTIIYIPDN
jgi:4-amino-4-deoxy-L-arabinose transferase-like glycosyltransferase